MRSAYFGWATVRNGESTDRCFVETTEMIFAAAPERNGVNSDKFGLPAQLKTLCGFPRRPHLRGADSGAELLEKGAFPGAVVFAAQRQLLHRFALVGAEFTGLGERENSRESTGKARESGLFPRENRPVLDQ
jgi:hypothetical protein